MQQANKKLVDGSVFAAEAAAAADPLVRIRELGLTEKVAELEVHGYTVVRAGEWDDHGLTPRILETLLAVSQRRTGIRPDLAGGKTHSRSDMATGQHMFYLLLEDPVFEQAITADVPLALMSYLLGESAVLSSLSSMMRGPGTPALDLHTDMILTPSPFASYSQVTNINWTLTDYSPENGSTCFWPGSHKFCRRPTSAECADTARFVPVTAPPGSLVLWHGNTWHGSFARKNPGLRVQLIMFYCRPYFLTQEWYRDKISAEIIARNKPRFKTLVGGNNPYPFSFERLGPDYAQLAQANAKTALLEG